MIKICKIQQKILKIVKKIDMIYQYRVVLHDDTKNNVKEQKKSIKKTGN